MATNAIKRVTIAAGAAVDVLTPVVGTLSGSYSMLIYAPQSESLSLSLADAAGAPTDPEALIPAADNPYYIDSTSVPQYLFNGGSASVSVLVMAWSR